MELLVHVCCSNCAIFPVSTLAERCIGLRGYWYNPNIHPEEEYSKRLGSLRRLEGLWGLDIEYEDRDGLDEFKRAVAGAEGLRCGACYLLRLRRTASAARRMGLRGFTTTLLSSPYQRHDLIVSAGREAARAHSVEFFDEDFRAGWDRCVSGSKELGLYRQKYCGCLYSLAERNERKKALTRGLRRA